VPLDDLNYKSLWVRCMENVLKRVYLILASIWLVTIPINAQYKINKTKYNFYTYSYQKEDPYNPTISGFASIVPGLGQMISGEGGRGLCFLGGCIGSAAVSFAGVAVFANSIPPSDSEPVNEGQMLTGLLMVAAGIGGVISIDIWSIVDAVHVAKVNNLSFRDQNKTSFNLKLKPHMGSSGYFILNEEVPVGLTLLLTF